MDFPESTELNRVAKDTVETFHYEARTYHALQTLQGYAVPVYLGDIYLRQNIYYLPTRAIVHICLMAWGGKASKLSDDGIEHLDERAPNMLWNDEVQRVMFIDFGHAKATRKRKSSGLKRHSSKSKGQKIAMRRPRNGTARTAVRTAPHRKKTRTAEVRFEPEVPQTVQT
ncbi:hypothetical protein BDV29DRAFT_160578 [Aspergillus leporis]|uniref:Protein kinase domain-containing protein n=1 Tax=Aspergillus leporis TaxID=41062 RepID=A0A5N5WRM2_9EURO|nr:hypothetical protein BDV29DRAFT_160578 [Aspergillus leporis]